MLWQLWHQIRSGDLVVTNPSPITRAPVLLGRCTGSYYFDWAQSWGRFRGRDFHFPHRIDVAWLGSITHRRLPDALSAKLRRRGRTVKEISDHSMALEDLLRRL